MLALYFLIGLLLVGAVLYWQDELGVGPRITPHPFKSGSVVSDPGHTIFTCIGTFFLWPATAVVLGALFLRKRKLEKAKN